MGGQLLSHLPSLKLTAKTTENQSLSEAFGCLVSGKVPDSAGRKPPLRLAPLIQAVKEAGFKVGWNTMGCEDF